MFNIYQLSLNVTITQYLFHLYVSTITQLSQQQTTKQVGK